MMPFAQETVTLFHRTRDGCARVVLKGCAWRQTSARDQDGGLFMPRGRYLVRGPAGSVRPGVGDVLVRGEVDDAAALGLNTAALLEKYAERGAFLCESVADSAFPGAPLPHWRAEG